MSETANTVCEGLKVAAAAGFGEVFGPLDGRVFGGAPDGSEDETPQSASNGSEQSDNGDYLTVTESAQLLRASRSFVRKCIKRGDLQAVRLSAAGKKMYIRRAELLKMLVPIALN